jgi:Mrp family chromosome partitioning ATPase/capsular polysaccharide biosynthesis protein
MDLVRYLRVLRRHWRIIAVLAVLGAVAGALLVPKPKPEGATAGGTAWIAVHTLFDSSVNNRSRDSGFATVTAEQAAFLVKSGDVPDRAAKEIGGNPADLAADVVARPNSNLGTIEVTARGPSPGEARKLSDVFAESLLSSVQDIQQREIDRNRDVLNAAISQLELELVAVLGEDRPAATARERINGDISQKRQQLQELDQRAAQGANIYSFGSSEAFQVTPNQLDTLFSTDTTSTGATGRASRDRTSTRDLRNQADDSGGIQLNPLMGAILGLSLGGLAGVMLVLVINTLDPRIFTKEDAEDALGFPIIAEIPAFNRKLRKETIVISREAPYSRFAEAYRVLRSSVLFANSEGDAGATGNGNGAGNGAGTQPSDPSGQYGDATGTGEHRRQAVVIMVTSPGPSEGKTTTVSNLATVLAEDGSSILVVNCDFRRPRLHSYLGGGGEPRKVFDTAVPGVKLVTGVVDEPERAAPAEVIAAQRRLIVTAKNHFDFILLDTAPILTTNDASELLSVVDMVVMITRSAKTTKESADRAAELLERFRAPVVGGVLVAAANAPTRQYYYYYAASGPKPAPESESTNPLEGLQPPSKGRGRERGFRVGARSRSRDAGEADSEDDDGSSDAKKSPEEPPEA